MTRSIFVSAAFLVLAAAPSVAQQRAAAASNAVVTIRTDNADVTVVGWLSEEVVVRTRGTSRGVRMSGERTRLLVRSDDDEDLEIRVPRGARVDVHTQNGDVSVSGVTGSVYLESLSGDFRVAGEPHLVEIEGLSGNIAVLGRATTVNVNTTSGNIHLPRASGTIDAATTSGDILISSDGLER